MNEYYAKEFASLMKHYLNVPDFVEYMLTDELLSGNFEQVIEFIVIKKHKNLKEEFENIGGKK